MEFPTTLIEFQDRFPDETSCWRYLKEVRWPDGFGCPRCQGNRHTYLEGRRLFQCRGCHAQTSLTARTVLHGTRTPLRKWFLAMFFFARHKQSISALQLKRDLGLSSYGTAWTMLHKLRAALRRRPHQLLKGDVEADETFVGGPRSGGKRGRGAPNKTMVLVAVERREASAGALALQVVPDGSWDSLGPELRGVIEGKNTTVHTDDWSGYLPLAQNGVRHRPRTQGAPERAAAILPWAHIVASNLKAWLLGTFRGVSPKHLQRYLDEFVYRFNRRGIEEKLFFYVARRAAEGDPLPYHRLTAEAVG
jgi:transposase-like protein